MNKFFFGILLILTLYLTIDKFFLNTGNKSNLSHSKMADAIHKVIENDRTIYTRKVVQRLVNDERVIKATESWYQDKTLPLPAQMFRMSSELNTETGSEFYYSLQSLWPINLQNAKSQTDIVKQGLRFVVDNGGTEPFYAEEELAGKKYFTAVYADIAVAEACVLCHNAHKDSPRSDFKLNDVMGGVVVRLPK